MFCTLLRLSAFFGFAISWQSGPNEKIERPLVERYFQTLQRLILHFFFCSQRKIPVTARLQLEKRTERYRVQISLSRTSPSHKCKRLQVKGSIFPSTNLHPWFCLLLFHKNKRTLHFLNLMGSMNFFTNIFGQKCSQIQILWFFGFTLRNVAC